MPIPCRRSFQPGGMSRRVLCGIRPSFPGLFPGRGQVAYVLLTSAPVAIGVIAHPMMPLDLHVLSLSLAFILSQDQTLRCCMSCLSLQKKISDTRPMSPRPADRCRFIVYLESQNLNGDMTVPCSLVLRIRCCNISMISRPLRRQKNRSLVLRVVRRTDCKGTTVF